MQNHYWYSLQSQTLFHLLLSGYALVTNFSLFYRNQSQKELAGNWGLKLHFVNDLQYRLNAIIHLRKYFRWNINWGKSVMRRWIKFKMTHLCEKGRGERSASQMQLLSPYLFIYLFSLQVISFNRFYKINSPPMILIKSVKLIFCNFSKSVYVPPVKFQSNDNMQTSLFCSYAVLWFFSENLYKKLTCSTAIMICSEEPNTLRG